MNALSTFVDEDEISLRRDSDGMALMRCGVNHADAEMLRRLAAAWNFCDGIPTEKLEGTDVAGFVSAKTMLTGITTGNGGATVGFEGGACGLLAASFAEQFKDAGAENYLELGFSHPSTGPLQVTIQRTHGKTPAQLKREAEQRLEAVLADLEWITGNGPDDALELRDRARQAINTIKAQA